MRYLLDSHIAIWWAEEPQRLSMTVNEVIADPGNELFISAASLWELSIKVSLKRLYLDLAYLRRGMAQRRVQELPITGDHAVAVLNLSNHHRDPFDRLLLAQAKVEDLTLVTADRSLAEYGIPVLLA